MSPGTDLAALGLGDATARGGIAGWFLDHLPALQAEADAGRLTLRECIQRAGELVYVPCGWHHAVVNLELSCAIAHTLIAPAALDTHWAALCARYPAFSCVLAGACRSRMAPCSCSPALIGACVASPGKCSAGSSDQLIGCTPLLRARGVLATLPHPHHQRCRERRRGRLSAGGGRGSFRRAEGQQGSRATSPAGAALASRSSGQRQRGRRWS